MVEAHHIAVAVYFLLIQEAVLQFSKFNLWHGNFAVLKCLFCSYYWVFCCSTEVFANKFSFHGAPKTITRRYAMTCGTEVPSRICYETVTNLI